MKKTISLIFALCMTLCLTVPAFAASPQKPSVKYETTVGSTPIKRYLLHKSPSEEYLEDAGTIEAGTTLQVVDELTINGTKYGIYLDEESDSLSEEPPKEPSEPQAPNGPGGQKGSPGHEPPTRPAKGSAPSGPPPAFCFKLEDLQASLEATTAAPTTAPAETTAATTAQAETGAAETQTETSTAAPATTQPEETGTTAAGTEQTTVASSVDDTDDQNEEAERWVIGLFKTFQKVLIFAAVILALIVVLIVLLVRMKKKKNRTADRAEEGKETAGEEKTGKAKEADRENAEKH